MLRIMPKSLRAVGYELFESAGCAPEDAKKVADHLVDSSLYGHHSHGTIRLYEYVGQIEDGSFRA